MKQYIRRIFSFLLALALMTVVSVVVLADSGVTYEGSAREFVFVPGSQDSPTDLFENFKNAMPGDSVEQKITVRNDASKKVKVKLYMRALGSQEGSEAFLSQMKLTVTQEGDTVLFEAPSDRTAQLTDWVCLGLFYSGAEVDLNTRLDVPIEMGNEFQNSIGYLDWQFKVEEYPVSSADPQSPQTGDNGLLLPMIGLCAGMVGISLIFIFSKKRKSV